MSTRQTLKQRSCQSSNWQSESDNENRTERRSHAKFIDSPYHAITKSKNRVGNEVLQKRKFCIVATFLFFVQLGLCYLIAQKFVSNNSNGGSQSGTNSTSASPEGKPTDTIATGDSGLQTKTNKVTVSADGETSNTDDNTTSSLPQVLYEFYYDDTTVGSSGSVTWKSDDEDNDSGCTVTSWDGKDASGIWERPWVTTVMCPEKDANKDASTGRNHVKPADFKNLSNPVLKEHVTQVHKNSIIKPAGLGLFNEDEQSKNSGYLPMSADARKSKYGLDDASDDTTETPVLTYEGVNFGGNLQIYLISGVVKVTAEVPTSFASGFKPDDGTNATETKKATLKEMADSVWISVGVHVKIEMYQHTQAYIVGGKFDLQNKDAFVAVSSFWGDADEDSDISEYFFRVYNSANADSFDNDVHINDYTGEGPTNIDGYGTAKGKDMVWSSTNRVNPPNISPHICSNTNDNLNDPNGTDGTSPFAWCHLHPLAGLYMPFRGGICFWTDEKRCSSPGHARWTSPGLFYYESFVSSGVTVEGGYTKYCPDGASYCKSGEILIPDAYWEEHAKSNVDVEDGDVKWENGDCNDPMIFSVTNFDTTVGSAGAPNFTDFPANATTSGDGIICGDSKDCEFPAYYVSAEKPSLQCPWGWHKNQTFRTVWQEVRAVENIAPTTSATEL